MSDSLHEQVTINRRDLDLVMCERENVNAEIGSLKSIIKDTDHKVDLLSKEMNHKVDLLTNNFNHLSKDIRKWSEETRKEREEDRLEQKKQNEVLDINTNEIGKLKVITKILVGLIMAFVIGLGNNYLKEKRDSRDYSKKTKQAYSNYYDQGLLSPKV